MPKQAFKSKVAGMGPNNAWCFLPVPLDVRKLFGKVRVPVRGTINGFPFRSTIMVLRGQYLIQFNKQLQEGANAKAGDIVKVVFDADHQPRTVKVPRYLSKSLATNKKAKEAYEKLAYSHQKRFVDWVADAKTEETRHRRMEKMTKMLLAGETID